MQQGQPQFVQPMVNPQGQPIRQQRQPSSFRQGFNPLAQPFLSAAEAQPNAVPYTPENKVPKSNGTQGVKSSGPDCQTCFSRDIWRKTVLVNHTVQDAAPGDTSQ